MTNRILIIEDNAGISELFADKLTQLGFVTHIADTGEKAMKILKEQKTDLVVMDFSLPDMDGKEIILRLRESGHKMPPFIVSTGRGDEQLAVDMMKLGAFDYLIKDPFLMDRLPEVIVRLVYDINRDAELKQAQDALQESEERFRSLVENSSDLFVRVSKKGEYLYVSPNVEKLLGFETKEFMGKSYKNFILQEDLPGVAQVFDYVLKGPSRTGSVEYRILHKDGSLRYHSARGYSVMQDNVIYLNCIARDVTEKYVAEKRIAKAIFETEEKEKKHLAEKLHENIGPLISVIKLYMAKIRSLESNRPEDFKIINYVDQLVDDAVGKVRDLANELMPSVLFDFGLEKALKAFAKNMNPSNDVKLTLSFKNSLPDLPAIIEIILYRAIADLVDNALKSKPVNAINIELGLCEGGVTVLYKDNRKHLDPSLLDDQGLKCVGFHNIKKRVEAASGSVLFQKRKSGGLQVTIRMCQV